MASTHTSAEQAARLLFMRATISPALTGMAGYMLPVVATGRAVWIPIVPLLLVDLAVIEILGARAAREHGQSMPWWSWLLVAASTALGGAGAWGTSGHAWWAIPLALLPPLLWLLLVRASTSTRSA